MKCNKDFVIADISFVFTPINGHIELLDGCLAGLGHYLRLVLKYFGGSELRKS